MAAETLPAAARADRLSEVLRRCGALENGLVSDVAVDSSRATILSRITRLRLTYAGEVPGAPSTLILKTSVPERIGKPDWDGGRREVAFYDDVAAAMPAGLVPRCFEAKWEADTRAWHLLLEDLTDSHLIASTWPLPPSAAQCEKIVRAKARFHAIGGMILDSAPPSEPGFRPITPNSKSSMALSRGSSIASVTCCLRIGAISTDD